MARKQLQPLSEREIELDFKGIESRFPPSLTVEQAADLAGSPKATIYDWHSRGLLKGIAVRRGKRLRLHRNRFFTWLYSD